MALRQKYTGEIEIEVTMAVAVLVLELLEDQQDEFFEKIATIYFDEDQIDIGMALTCCGNPVYMELSIAKVDDVEGEIMQVYFLNYIDVDRYLDYINLRRYV
jgi:hypothetical protein